MKHLRPVIWSKGTFLTPQHLQVQDKFLEDSLHFHLEALSFRPWGFTDLVVDQGKLAAGQFAISKAAGTFPDGLVFDIPGSDPPPASKSLLEFFEPDAATLDVFLAVPDYRDGAMNVARAIADGNVRYLAEVVAFRDENTGANEKPIQIARKNLQLLTAAENRQGSSALRVARVEKNEAGKLQLDPRFVPPLLNIEASSYLFGLLRRMVEILSAKSSQLSGLRRQKNQSLAEFTSADVANFWLLYTANTYLPVLNHLFELKKGHPQELYQILISLAGSLTTFSAKFKPSDLPLYDHDELGKCYAELDEKLRNMLETVVDTNVISLPLKEVQQFIYATSLSDEKYLKDTKLYLAISADTSEEQLIRKAPQLLKVCSATHVDHLVKQALPGIQLTHLTSPPSAIPVRMKWQYFGLNQSGASWEAVKRSRNFAAFVPGDFPNPQLELLILLPQAG